MCPGRCMWTAASRPLPLVHAPISGWCVTRHQSRHHVSRVALYSAKSCACTGIHILCHRHICNVCHRSYGPVIRPAVCCDSIAAFIRSAFMNSSRRVASSMVYPHTAAGRMLRSHSCDHTVLTQSITSTFLFCACGASVCVPCHSYGRYWHMRSATSQPDPARPK